MARPGGNATGFTNLDPRMAGKWLELLKEIAPQVARVVIPFNPGMSPYSELYLDEFRGAAATLGMGVIGKPVRDLGEVEAVVAAAAAEPNTGLVPMPSGFFFVYRGEITSLTGRHRVPAVYTTRSFATSGGLVSYGNDNVDNWRRAAVYVDKILRGEKPGELPVQFPVKFELVINLKAAMALGVTLPPTLVARADEVIE
jgi:ABC-type uncharacterized transport system substrate-binding protein